VNPLVKKQLERLQRTAEELRSAAADSQARMARQHEEREKLQQENWRQQKELAALHRMAEDYDQIEVELKQLQARRNDLQDGLQRILSHTKALANEYRS